jgi:hypothetical protein
LMAARLQLTGTTSNPYDSASILSSSSATYTICYNLAA